jgi:hypothetical protein
LNFQGQKWILANAGANIKAIISYFILFFSVRLQPLQKIAHVQAEPLGPVALHGAPLQYRGNHGVNILFTSVLNIPFIHKLW